MIDLMRLKVTLLLAAASAVGFAQAESDLIFRQTFQEGTGGWAALGERASVSRAPESHALVFSYELAPKIFSGVVSPVPAEFAKMQRLRLHVKTDHATAMGLLLSEKKPGGGNYSAWFWSPADTWQWIELTPADFSLNDGPDDAKDSDGKLDLADVEAIGLFDLGQFFAQMPANPDFPVVVSLAKGQHTARVDGFEILSSPAAQPVPANALRMGMFDRNFTDWVTLGGMDLKLSSGSNPLNAPALEASYHETEGHFQLLLRRVTGSETAKAKRLVFDIASERDVTLMVSLEMNKPGGGQGPRFTLPIYPPGGKEIFHVNLDLADFQGDGKFDPGQWRSLAIVDITGVGGGQSGPNTLWIGNVAAMKE
jgi:hypothetical protein